MGETDRKETLADTAIGQTKEKQYDTGMAGKICYIGMAHYGKRVCVKWEYKTK